MSYTVFDLVEKLILIEQKTQDMYIEIANSALLNSSLRILSKVLGAEEKRHVEYYKTLKENLLNKELAPIDFDIYDKVSFLLDTFKLKIASPTTENTNDFIIFALNLEKENVALLIDVQGRLVRKTRDTETITYKAISQIIKQEETHVKNLEKLIR